jgi:hypothetical protein
MTSTTKNMTRQLTGHPHLVRKILIIFLQFPTIRSSCYCSNFTKVTCLFADSPVEKCFKLNFLPFQRSSFEKLFGKAKLSSLKFKKLEI